MNRYFLDEETANKCMKNMFSITGDLRNATYNNTEIPSRSRKMLAGHFIPYL